MGWKPYYYNEVTQTFHSFFHPTAQDSGTKNKKDKGIFKTPGLRNIALTAPYMHDGSLKTLEEVIDFYNYGCGDDTELDLTLQEKGDLVAFLKALTGELPRIEPPGLSQ